MPHRRESSYCLLPARNFSKRPQRHRSFTIYTLSENERCALHLVEILLWAPKRGAKNTSDDWLDRIKIAFLLRIYASESDCFIFGRRCCNHFENKRAEQEWKSLHLKPHRDKIYRSGWARIREIVFEMRVLITPHSVFFVFTRFDLPNIICRPGLAARAKQKPPAPIFEACGLVFIRIANTLSMRDRALRFRRPRITSWFADFPYRGRTLYFASLKRKAAGAARGQGYDTPWNRARWLTPFLDFESPFSTWSLTLSLLRIAPPTVTLLSPTSSPFRSSSSFLKGVLRLFCPFATRRAPAERRAARYRPEKELTRERVFSRKYVFVRFPEFHRESSFPRNITRRSRGITKEITSFVCPNDANARRYCTSAICDSFSIITIAERYNVQIRPTRERYRATVTAAKCESYYVAQRKSNIFRVQFSAALT